MLYKNCWMDSHIKGWDVPRGSKAADWVNLTFAEYNTTGPGAKKRAEPGTVFTAAQAAKWTAKAVLKGWDPMSPSQQPW